MIARDGAFKPIYRGRRPGSTWPPFLPRHLEYNPIERSHMAEYVEHIRFRVTASEEQKLRQLTNAAMASPSETLRFLIQGVSCEDMVVIRERALKQEGR
jgi:hypothetical protein